MANLGTDIYKQLIGSAPEQARWSPTTMTPEQQRALAKIVSQLSSEGVTGPEYEGELVAGLGNLEAMSLEALEQMILKQATGEGAAADAETALSELIKSGGAPTDFEDFYRTSVHDPLLQEFSESVLPELTRRFGSSGAFGSDRKLAEQQATERLVKTLAGTRGELAFKTQESAANRLLQAIGLAPQLEGADTANVLAMLEGAGLPRQIQQARLTSEYGEFQRQQEERSKRIAQLLAALGVKGVENIATGLGGQRGEIGMQASSTKSALGNIF